MSRLAGTFARHPERRARRPRDLRHRRRSRSPSARRRSWSRVARAGADVLEVGVPFSDPLADGPVIQRASERALAGGMTLRGVARARAPRARRCRHADRALHLRESGRPHGRRACSPARGRRRRRRRARSSTIRSRRPSRCARRCVDAGLDPIFLISPTTTTSGFGKSAALGAGFLYVISRLGVTGVRDRLPEDVGALMAARRALRRLPVALGFGIARPEHVAEACRVGRRRRRRQRARQRRREHAASSNVCAQASEYVRWLKNESVRRSRRAAARRSTRSTSAGAPAERARGMRARDRPREEARRAADLPAVARSRRARPRPEINPGPLDDGAVRRLFERIIDEARRLERIAEAEARVGRIGAPARREGGHPWERSHCYETDARILWWS